MDCGDTVYCNSSSPKCSTEIDCAGFETSRNLHIMKYDPLLSCHPEIML